jgi:hypothetical protein
MVQLEETVVWSPMVEFGGLGVAPALQHCLKLIFGDGLDQIVIHADWLDNRCAA